MTSSNILLNLIFPPLKDLSCLQVDREILLQALSYELILESTILSKDQTRDTLTPWSQIIRV